MRPARSEIVIEIGFENATQEEVGGTKHSAEVVEDEVIDLDERGLIDALSSEDECVLEKQERRRGRHV